MADRLLTADDVAETLGVPKSWVYAASRRATDGDAGRDRRYRREAVDAWTPLAGAAMVGGRSFKAARALGRAPTFPGRGPMSQNRMRNTIPREGESEMTTTFLLNRRALRPAPAPIRPRDLGTCALEANQRAIGSREPAYWLTRPQAEREMVVADRERAALPHPLPPRHRC